MPSPDLMAFGGAMGSARPSRLSHVASGCRHNLSLFLYSVKVDLDVWGTEYFLLYSITSGINVCISTVLIKYTR